MRQNRRFMLTALLALVAIMTLCFTLAACNAKEYSVNLQFNEAEGNVELSPAAENGKYKEGTELTVTVTPNTGYVLDEFKLSTDSNAALDSNGKFVFNVSDDTTINVTFKPEPKQKYTLTLPQSVANGEIKVSPESADNKYEVGTQLTITLEPASQYEVATFTVGGVDHKADLQDNKYSFAISGDTEIAATFSKIINRYTLTVPTVENGEIKVSPESADHKYDEGTQITITLEPAAQYEVATFKVGGVDHKADLQDNKYTFAINGETAIEASFSKVKYTLTLPQSVANGEIKVSPESADNKYEVGTQLTITLEPASQYEVATFTVGGVDHKADLQDNKYSFAISGDTEIAATFSKIINKYTLTVPTVENGEIKVSPESADHKYDEGTQITITLEPAVGYEVSEFSVDNVDKKSELQDNVYTFSIEKETSINASFSKIQYNVTTEVKGVSEKGSISLAPQKSTYEYGDQITVTVTVQYGHGITPGTFKVSTDEEAVLSDENTYTLTVSADTQIEVTIHEHEYTTYKMKPTDSTMHESYCDVCDEHMQENHTKYEVITPTADGETVTCSKNCGLNRQMSHKFGDNWIDDGEGKCYQKCQNIGCGYETTHQEHEMEWHKLANESEGHSGNCKHNCGYTVEKEEHDKLGEGGACSKCGYKETEEHVCAEHIDADSAGYYDGACSICGKNLFFTVSNQGVITKFEIPATVKLSEQKIKIPEKVDNVTVVNMGNGTFTAKQITAIVIPETITTLSQFTACTSLKTVIIRANVTELLPVMFQMCNALTDIVLPATLTSIPDNAFGATPALAPANIKNVYFMGDQAAWTAITSKFGASTTSASAAALLKETVTTYFLNADENGWEWQDEAKEIPTVKQ